MAINKDKKFVYRIIHKDNLSDVLTYGLVNGKHKNSNKKFIVIGDTDIIGLRTIELVKLDGYGCIGDYIPFHFTPRSIMLYNIITGYKAPKVPKRSKNEIIVIRCLIEGLAKRPKWFFTDGQALSSNHYNNLEYLDQIDWKNIQDSIFMKTEDDRDLARRYQAEFLVYDEVPIECIESLFVYDEETKNWTEELVKVKKLEIPVHIHKPYFFD